MATSDSSAALLYSLCALAAVGVLADVILLVWQLMTHKFDRGFRFVKGSLVLFDLFYALTGLAVILLLLHQDVAAAFLCKAGGFLILFATQETVWMLATSSVALLLWKRKSLSRDFQRRNLSIFLLIVAAETLILLTISFLPFTNINYFKTEPDYYFRCTPLRLPGEQGWAFSTLVLALNWIAIIGAVVTLTVVSVRYSKCTEPELSPAGKLLETLPSMRRLQRQIFLSLCVASCGWIFVHIVISISYFSSGKLDKGAVQWLLGFCISVILILHPVTFLAHSLLCKFVFPRYRKDPTGLKSLLESRPRSLENVQRFNGGQQDPGLVNFLVRWRDKGGCLQTGYMKLFTPSAQDKWRNEVNAIAKLGTLNHPNLAPYMWIATQNTFTSSLQAATRHGFSKRSLLVTRLQYPSGSLYSFLQNRIHQLTEIGLHKVTLDIASGLEFIHQHNLVHNGLTSHAVYMASISEKIGLKAVIGDLENCYEVPASNADHEGHIKVPKPWNSGSPIPDLFSITGRIEMSPASLANNRFSPDIRSFGMVVLEMLVAMTEYNQKRKPRLKVSSRANDEARHSMSSMQSFDDIPHRSAMTEIRGATTGSSSTDNEFELPAISHNISGHHKHHKSGEQCMCSSSVTDVRAVRKASSVHNRYSFQLDVSNQKCNEDMGESVHKLARAGALIEAKKDLRESDGENNYNPPHIIRSSTKALYSNYPPAPPNRRKPKPWELEKLESVVPGDLSQESLSPQSEYSPRSDDTCKSSISDCASRGGITRKLSHSSTEELEAIEKEYKILPEMSHYKIHLPDVSENETDYRTALTGQVRSSPRRGSYKQILTNGSFLTPRSTPENGPPSKPKKADACTDTADFSTLESNGSGGSSTGVESLPDATVDLDQINAAEAKIDSEYAMSKQQQHYSSKFQTIYEEEDGQKTNQDLGQRAMRKVQKMPTSRRRLPPVPLETGGSAFTSTPGEIARRKRHSMASLDESIASGDSGVGSSHYDNYSVSDQSSVYFNNVPGNREPMYVMDSKNQAQTSRTGHNGQLKAFGYRKHAHRPQDSGIESNADSCDELSRYDVPDSVTRLASSILANTEDPENVYEIVPELSGKGHFIKRKKPCVGHHEGVGHVCCSIKKANVSSDMKTAASSSKTKDSIHKSNSGAPKTWDSSSRKGSSCQDASANDAGKAHDTSRKGLEQSDYLKDNVEAQWKQLVDTATNTSDQDESFQEEEQKFTLATLNNDTPLEKKSHFVSTPMFTKLEAALLDELLDLRQQNNASRGSSSILSETHFAKAYSHDHEEDCCSSHCSNCKRLYKKAPFEGGIYLQPIANRKRHAGSLTGRLSNSNDSPSIISQATCSDGRSLSGDGSYAFSSRSTSRSGLGHRQLSQMQNLLHPSNIPIPDNGYEMNKMLEGFKKQGNLGFIAGQLLPLLSECCTDDTVPSADTILQRLEEVLPIAAV